MSSDAAAIIKRHNALKTKRQTEVENTWADCFALSLPLRGDGLYSGATVTGANAGNVAQSKIMDSTAGDCINILAANIMAGLTPANSAWFALDVGNETDEERRWLDESSTLLWENIHMGNFDAEGFECCQDIAAAGMFALFIDEDREKGGFTFHQWPLAQVYVSSTHADGRLNIVHREYELTAEQATEEFGEKNVPERIRKCMEGGSPDEPFTFIHAIYPRMGPRGSAKLARNMPIASCHIELVSKMECREGGYNEMPVVVPRWTRLPRSLYAVGPLYTALPNVRTLNDLKRLELDAADIAVSGMWIVEDDGVINTRTIKIGPRKMVIAASVDSMKALETGSNFQLSESMIAQLQAAIRKVMMADQLTPQDGPQMTATEIRVRVEMIRKLLGPIFGRLQAEYLKPFVERCFGLAYRAGVFKAPPQSLAGRNFSVRYVSPMARAQKLDEVEAIESTFAAALQLIQVEPDIMDRFDIGEAIKIMVEGRGAPVKILRDDDAIAAIREQRQAAAKQAQAQQMMAQTQQVGADAAAQRAATGA